MNYVARALGGEPLALLGAYHPMWAVDVRDTALAHIQLLKSTAVQSGERRLLVNGEKVLMEYLLHHLHGIFPESAGFALTKNAIDKEPDAIRKNEAYFREVWAGIELRNDSAVQLGVTFRPLQDTLRDAAESLIGICALKPAGKL